MSTFSGLSTALSSLYAQRRGLDVAGQNVANANTDGYSRQRVDLRSIGAPAGPAIFSTWHGAGGGVAVSATTRLHDEFLEARARNEYAAQSYLATHQQIHSRIEGVFNEPSETGLQSQLSDFWSAFHDVANRPGDMPARSQLLQRAATLTDSLQTSYDSVSTLWSSTRDQLDAIASEVNTTAVGIAQLNQGILTAKQAGLPANELADQRDAMVLRVSELTGATARVRDDGAVDVYIGGSALVSGINYRQITTGGARRLEDQAIDPPALQWADNASSVVVPSGEAASILETLTAVLPGVAASLDSVAARLAQTVNDQHVAGFDLAGNGGEPMFAGSTAASLTLVLTDPAKVAASGSAGAPLDGSNADALAGLVNLLDGPDETYRGVVIEFGVKAQAINRRMEIQANATLNVDSARASQSGVNLDEEMANLLTYQRAYEAAARLLTVVDSTLDTLINRMGS